MSNNITVSSPVIPHGSVKEGRQIEGKPDAGQMLEKLACDFKKQQQDQARVKIAWEEISTLCDRHKKSLDTLKECQKQQASNFEEFNIEQAEHKKDRAKFAEFEAHLKREQAEFIVEKAQFKVERTDFKTDRVNFQKEKAIIRKKRQNLRKQRQSSRKESGEVQVDVRTEFKEELQRALSVLESRRNA